MPARAARKTNSVGIRQLKAELSQHLRRVQAGETIQLTDRGRVIATITPAAQPDEDHPAVQWARALVAAGKASWSGGKPVGSIRPARLKAGSPTVSDAVIEDRR
jgi:prevent-host-death family protein